jgi:hypothetical protein
VPSSVWTGPDPAEDEREVVREIATA